MYQIKIHKYKNNMKMDINDLSLYNNITMPVYQKFKKKSNKKNKKNKNNTIKKDTQED